MAMDKRKKAAPNAFLHSGQLLFCDFKRAYPGVGRHACNEAYVILLNYLTVLNIFIFFDQCIELGYILLKASLLFR